MRMNETINLIHLKFFCDAVLYESISEASKKNYVSQSAVSQAITKLETVFGAQLVFLNRQKLQMTDEGKIVFEQAKNIFSAVKTTFDKVNETKEQLTGTLRFVTTKSLGMSHVAPWYREFKSRYPKVDFVFRMGGLNIIRTALKREEVEFAIVVYNEEFHQFEKYSLQKGVFNLYQSTDLDSEAIQEGVFVCEQDCMYVNELRQYMTGLGYENPIRESIAGWDIAARFTELNVGVSFFPDYVLATNRYPNIIVHPLKIPTYEYEICAIYNKGVKLSRAAKLFLEHLKNDD